jgi:hypothetical protein
MRVFIRLRRDTYGRTKKDLAVLFFGSGHHAQLRNCRPNETNGPGRVGGNRPYDLRTENHGKKFTDDLHSPTFTASLGVQCPRG